MPTIDELQREIVQDLNELGDSFDQYCYLVELSCRLPPMEPEEKTQERLVEGCQSKVWLALKAENGRFSMKADSSTQIVKGILKLLSDLFNGQPVEQVARAEITFLRDTLILDTFDSDRQKGVGSILKRIREFAQKAEGSGAAD